MVKFILEGSTKKKCADKYLVRNYVTSKDLGDILNPIYGVYQRPEDIEWNELPQKFVLKSSYGSGNNIICTDKTKLDINETKKKLKKWLKPQLLNTTAEMHYSQKTNVLICEKYIEIDQGNVPIDYKFYCFNGQPKVILAIKDRDQETEKMFYDINWNPLEEYANKYTTSGSIEKPSKLKEMLEYARKLSEDFPFVRVDFYNPDERVIFGELTFTPAACLSKSHNEEGDKYFGSLLKLPMNINNNESVTSKQNKEN